MPGEIIAIEKETNVPEMFRQNVGSVTGGLKEEVSLYVHLPFCRVKCTYCAFAISTDSRLEMDYISALIAELGARIPAGATLSTLYFGGGTPSRTSRESIERLALALSRWQLTGGAEVTLEANPEDITEESLEMWTTTLGVNRLSIGVQSFHEAELVPLGRGHGRAGAIDALALAATHVPRVSVDLILGLPGQTTASVAASAELATSGPVGHLSLYLLDLEPGSALEQRVGSGLVELPSEDVTAEMYRTVGRIATERGFHQYEVSNFSRPGEESVHNRRYWSRRPYIGAGLGAHSFDGKVRSSNTRAIREYIEIVKLGALPETFRESLGDEEERHEKIFLGLRQSRGLAMDELRDLVGERVEGWLEEWLEQGWVTLEEGWVRFTVEGFLVSDELLAELF